MTGKKNEAKVPASVAGTTKASSLEQKREVDFAVPVVSPRAVHYTKVNFPMDVFEAAEEWLAKHPGHTLHSMIFCGLASLGVNVAAEHLKPRINKPYKRRSRS